VRISVVTYGSEGDTRPFVALCRGLMDSGHEVQLFAEQASAYNAQLCGVPVQVLPGDVKSTLPMGDPLQEMRRAEVVKAIRACFRLVKENSAAWMRAVATHASSSDAILFAGLASPVARIVAEELKKPAIELWVTPTTPTCEYPTPTLRPMNLPGWINLLSYRLSPRALTQRYFGKPAAAARKAIFGNAPPARVEPEFPILYGFSRHLVQRPGDWPDAHQVCGHWALPSVNWQAPSDLLHFLSAGPPPIYVGFGAVSSFLRQKGINAIASAVGGRRTLFYPGWSKITAAVLPKNFFVLENTPHSWLFPLTSMVIHHCGAGTTHTAARAGVPSVPVPFGADQFFWAGRLASAGVAAKYVPGTRIDASKLASMIEFAELDCVRERARALGVAMSIENGIALAIAEIESKISGMSFANGR
jgi:sterol 3beta-glucosyltransferase